MISHCRGAVKSKTHSNAVKTLHRIDMSKSIAASPTPSTATVEGCIWEVQEIIAERTSITTGGHELLVVWKTSWVPMDSMIADCPAMRRWNETYKWRFCDCCEDAVMHVILPVEPGSRMANDMVEAYAAKAQMIRRTATARRARADRGPSKASRCEGESGKQEAFTGKAETQPRCPE